MFTSQSGLNHPNDVAKSSTVTCGHDSQATSDSMVLFSRPKSFTLHFLIFIDWSHHCMSQVLLSVCVCVGCASVATRNPQDPECLDAFPYGCWSKPSKPSGTLVQSIPKAVDLIARLQQDQANDLHYMDKLQDFRLEKTGW